MQYATRGKASRSYRGRGLRMEGHKVTNAVFWNVTPCGSCKNRRFGGTWRLHHQGDKNRCIVLTEQSRMSACSLLGPREATDTDRHVSVTTWGSMTASSASEFALLMCPCGSKLLSAVRRPSAYSPDFVSCRWHPSSPAISPLLLTLLSLSEHCRKIPTFRREVLPLYAWQHFTSYE
jgi:hypothetical protein